VFSLILHTPKKKNKHQNNLQANPDLKKNAVRFTIAQYAVITTHILRITNLNNLMIGEEFTF